jgi:iron complex outermembrane recepter protein
MKGIAFRTALLASATAGICGSAQAQTSPAPETELGSSRYANSEDSTSGLDAIVVTARRRAEDLQDVPVAITAIQGDSLDQVGVRQATDLIKVVPSIGIIQNSGRRDVIVFELRGVSAGDTLLPQDPGVAVYVNDFVHARTYGLQGALYDLESVQVLYGPQGTLFGRNSTAGAVLINTKKPNTDRISGDFRFSLGNYSSREAFGALNVPLGEKVAVRVAGDFKQRDGFTRNVTKDIDVDNVNQRAFRVSLLLEPVADLTNVTVYDNFWSSDNGTGSKLTAARPFPTVDPQILRLTGISNNTGVAAAIFGNATLAAAVADSAALGPRQVRQDALTYSDQKVISVVNTTEFQMTDIIALKNIFGYIKYDTNTNTDLDGSALPLLAVRQFVNADQISNEFQIQADMGSVNAIVGAYYFREKGFDSAFANAFSPQPPGRSRTDITAGTTDNKTYAENISKSVFGQATWKVTPDLSLTAGLRYTWDTRKIDALSSRPVTQECLVIDPATEGLPTPARPLPITNCSRKSQKDFSDPSYTLSVDYKVTDDILLYAAHRRGYRSGGFNPRGLDAATLEPFEPEKITDFEVGLKSEFDLGGMRTRFNAAAFMSNYSNIQRTVAVVIQGVPLTTVVNAASAEIKGGEVSLTVEPARGFTLSGNASLVDYKVGRFNDTVTNSLTTPPTSVPVVVSDQTFPVSKWQWGVNATYVREVGTAGELSAVFNYKWRSESAGNGLSFPFTDAEANIPSFGIADASIRLSDIGGSPLFAGAFVSNLFDTTALVGGLSIQRTFGITTATYLPPRMFGFELGAKF